MLVTAKRAQSFTPGIPGIGPRRSAAGRASAAAVQKWPASASIPRGPTLNASGGARLNKAAGIHGAAEAQHGLS